MLDEQANKGAAQQRVPLSYQQYWLALPDSIRNKEDGTHRYHPIFCR